MLPKHVDLATRIKLQLGGVKNLSPKFTKEQLRSLLPLADFVLEDYLKKVRSGKAGRKRKEDSSIKAESIKIREKRENKRITAKEDLEQLERDLRHLIAIK